MDKDTPCAYVTLITTISYLPGVLVLCYSLRSTASRYPLVVMVTPSVSQDARDVLTKSGIILREIQSLYPQSASGEQLCEDRFVDTWTKLRAFELFEFRRIVLLDCDMLIRRNMDDLFDLDLAEDQIAATYVCACNPRKFKHYPVDWYARQTCIAPGVVSSSCFNNRTPQNCAYSSYVQINATLDKKITNAPRPHNLLNSGLVVLTPSMEQANKLFKFISSGRNLTNFVFPDQDLLSEVYAGKWKPISWEYNALRMLRTVHPDVWDDDKVRCVHYILSDKPWRSRKNPDVNALHFGVLHEWWWQVFDEVSRELDSLIAEGSQFVKKYVDNSV